MTEKSPGSSGSKGAGRAAPPARGKHRWHAVAIRPKGTCCEAAQAARAARYLSAEAPRLPLLECTNAGGCTCIYKHLPDRRMSSRREEDGAGIRRGNKGAQERRKERDRRKSEFNDPE